MTAMQDSHQVDSTFPTTDPVTFLKIVARHPGLVLPAISAVSYLAVAGYYAGRARAFGVPFGFSFGAAQYIEPLIHFVIFAVTCFGGLAVGVFCHNAADSHVNKQLQGRPRWVWIFTYLFIVAVFVGLEVLVWLIFPTPLATVVGFVVVAGLTGFSAVLLYLGRRSAVWLALGSGIAILVVFFTMQFFGEQIERQRVQWTVATVGSDHFLVAGLDSDSLLVTPLISTDPPTYVKTFHYIRRDAPGLSLQRAEFVDMVRLTPNRVAVGKGQKP